MDWVVRDHHTNNKIICLKSVHYSKFKEKQKEYEDLKIGRKKCGHWLLHNFPDLRLTTRCKHCGITVEEVMRERGKLK